MASDANVGAYSTLGGVPFLSGRRGRRPLHGKDGLPGGELPVGQEPPWGAPVCATLRNDGAMLNIPLSLHDSSKFDLQFERIGSTIYTNEIMP